MRSLLAAILLLPVYAHAQAAAPVCAVGVVSPLCQVVPTALALDVNGLTYRLTFRSDDGGATILGNN